MSVFSSPKPVIQFPYNGPIGAQANVIADYRTVNFNWDGARGCDFQIPRLNGIITYATLNQVQAWIGPSTFIPAVATSVLIQIRKGADSAAPHATNPTTQGRGTLVYQCAALSVNADTGTTSIERVTSTVTVSSEEKISIWMRNSIDANPGDEFGIMTTWNLIDNS